MAILAQSSADFALTYNFQCTHILGASRGHLGDSVIFLFIFIGAWFHCMSTVLYIILSLLRLLCICTSLSDE